VQNILPINNFLNTLKNESTLAFLKHKCYKNRIKKIRNQVET